MNAPAKTAAKSDSSPQKFSSAHSGMLQRKCACGGSPGASGMCEECQGKRLQRKLTIGSSNDPLEAEADRVADQVLAAPARAAVSSSPQRIQRFTGQSTEDAGTAPASVDRVLSGAGSPLEPALRQDMEQRFGHDFSQVRVHTGAAAQQSAREVNANAYTVGNNVVFGAGGFAPGTHEGRRLIAHELTHVVQQTSVDKVRVDQRNERLSPCALLQRDPAPAGQTLIEVKFPNEVKQLTQDEFAEYKRRAISNLRSDLELTAKHADGGRQSQESMLAEYQGGVESFTDILKKPKALIGIAADIKAGVKPPYIGAWLHPKHAVEQGIAACDRGDLGAAAHYLQIADDKYRDAMRAWNAYREATIGGAEGVQSNLETVRDISFAVALVAGAAVAAPVIAASVGAAGITGASATVLTTGGTALVTGAGGAALGGGSTAVASLAANGKIDVKAVKKDAVKFGKQGVVTGLTAGLGTSLNVAAKGVKLAQPFVQAAAKRCLTEAGVNVAGEVTTELLDKAVPAPGIKENDENGTKPLVPGPARAALTGCVSGVLGVPVAKLGRSGSKVTELAVGAGVGYADARLSGQGDKEALLAAAQNLLTSAAVTHGHAGTEHAKAMKDAQSHEGQNAAPKHDGSSAALKPTEHTHAATVEAKGGTLKPAEHEVTHSSVKSGQANANSPNAKGLGLKHAELDLGQVTEKSGLDVHSPNADSPIAVPHNEFDFGSTSEPSGLKVYTGKKPLDQIPGIKSPQPKFGSTSNEQSGTFNRTGMNYKLLNAAEISKGLRVDYDPVAGRPRKITYKQYSQQKPGADRIAQQTERNFTKDPTTEGAQSTNAAYRKSGFERGHLAPREAFAAADDVDLNPDLPNRLKVTSDQFNHPELAADQFTNVVPMKHELNQGSEWRASERGTIEKANKFGYVDVEIVPIYDENPPRLRDGTPVPKAVRRTIIGPDGTVLESNTYLNE